MKYGYFDTVACLKHQPVLFRTLGTRLTPINLHSELETEKNLGVTLIWLSDGAYTQRNLSLVFSKIITIKRQD